jgi:hypothetical protein
MNKSIASILLVVVVVVSSASAFTAIQPSAARSSPLAAPRRASLGPPFGPSSGTGTGTGTALHLKVKIDPEAAKKGNKNVAGNAKMAAYGGSVVIALMLPIAFLVWSAVSK